MSARSPKQKGSPNRHSRGKPGPAQTKEEFEIKYSHEPPNSYDNEETPEPKRSQLHIIELLSNRPRIADYIHYLEFSFKFSNGSRLETIFPILSKFHALQCIKLTFRTYTNSISGLPQCFTETALGNCLRLPTLQEVHIANLQFPNSILNELPNITRL